MKPRVCFAAMAAAFVIGSVVPGYSQLQREPNTSLRMPASLPVLGFTSERVFPTLSFTDPLAFATPPGETNRLFVVEQDGRIIVVTNLAVPTRTIFLDIVARVVGGGPPDERGLLGLAFHPGYATNGEFFVYYSVTATTSAGSGVHQRLSRFLVSTDPNRANAASEVPLISQFDQAGNHNGGDVQFGPDGYLYVTLGDEGNQDDSLNNSQRIDKDFHSGILRIDVSHRPGSLPPNPHPAVHTNTYTVPADNPFIGATQFVGRAVNPANVRTEFWAVGLRNPWRISFDPAAGILYCGDVGGGAREEIDIIVKGGNYGWAHREGNVAGPKPAPAGFTSIPPIADYTHGSGTNQGNSVTGGVVYRGDNLAQLYGAYVFADYVSGNVWYLVYDGTRSTPMRHMFRETGIAAFGVDPRNGDILLANQGQDAIKRLIYRTNVVAGESLPPTLADTGAFTDLGALSPHPGIVAYDLNLPFWSDGGEKRRWFSVPHMDQFLQFAPEGNWTFPTGTVWIKHFEIALTNSLPESRRRLETRFIVRTTNGVYGATYRWDSSTNAVLVPEAGLDETLTISDGATQRTQVWHYPSRAECLACHTTVGGLAVGFNTPQLNRDFIHGAVLTNQLKALSDAGYFTAPVTNVHTLRALAAPSDSSSSFESRVRSYLAANCSQCHAPNGPAVGFFDARLWPPTASAGVVDGELFNDFGELEHRVVRRGSEAHSVLLQRLQALGPGRMPPIDSTVIDANAVELVRQWITQELPGFRTFVEWQSEAFPAGTNADPGPAADPDGDGNPNYLEFLTGTNPRSDQEKWAVSTRRPSPLELEVVFPQTARRGFEVQWTANLFDPSSWVALDTLENRPFFSVSNRLGLVRDVLTNAATRFYRVRVYEP